MFSKRLMMRHKRHTVCQTSIILLPAKACNKATTPVAMDLLPAKACSNVATLAATDLRLLAKTCNKAAKIMQADTDLLLVKTCNKANIQHTWQDPAVHPCDLARMRLIRTRNKESLHRKDHFRVNMETKRIHTKTKESLHRKDPLKDPLRVNMETKGGTPHKAGPHLLIKGKGGLHHKDNSKGPKDQIHGLILV